MYKKRMAGVKVPHRKNTAAMAPERIPLPEQVVIPMSMHIGAPAKPLVNVGDEVKVGQIIAEEGGFVSAPIHASVAGKVTKIDTVLTSSGRYMPAITVKTSPEQPVDENIKPIQVTNKEDFLKAVNDSGVVGLGGAGFPTRVKLTVKTKVDYVLVNGAECEPYITSDTRTMLDKADLVMEGIELLKRYLQPQNVVIGIEDNKPDCIELYKKRCSKLTDVDCVALPSLYPQGGEKVLIHNITGRVVPAGKLPIDVGCVVINCTTLAAIANYVKTGMPLIEKTVTVDGSAVANPKNVIAPIGTLMKDVFEYCGGFKEEPGKVLYGGPMMGIAVPDLEQPIMKNTNAIIALNKKDGKVPEPTNCIHCGRCTAVCPLHITPFAIERAFKTEDDEALVKLEVMNCMECGCCSFSCPAKRPLVQVNKLAKMRVKAYQTRLEAEKKAAAEAAGNGEVKQ
ncbi:MAG: electron transport complex subunit RsxC [Lachnospiraceae bacterium]|nr:electron transport complex subunit RsxC [Lachnospiraceae bacterium]